MYLDAGKQEYPSIIGPRPLITLGILRRGRATVQDQTGFGSVAQAERGALKKP